MMASSGESASGAPLKAPDDALVSAGALAVGEVIAEGGEGRVHRVGNRPGEVLKAYRQHVPLDALEELAQWPRKLSPAAAARVGAACAWPKAIVVDGTAAGDEPKAAGLLIDAAPERFYVRHRDGRPRLATLSYLTTDPTHRAAAYGLDLPPPMDPRRLGLVYALAGLLAAFESASPAAVHGDLSAKNVLWSLQSGPEVFLIDCDNVALYGSSDVDAGNDGSAGAQDAGNDGSAGAQDAGNGSSPERRRAMTPNWDDPAVPTGHNPDRYSDRYSLALIFLRVVGAGHFPLQARQRQGGKVMVDFEVPAEARRLPAFGRGADLWRCCAWGLATEDPSRRPSPAVWASVLEATLEGMGAGEVIRQVWSAQEGLDLAAAETARPELPAGSATPLSAARAGASLPAGPAPHVVVRPVAPSPRRQAKRLVEAVAGDDEAIDAFGPLEALKRVSRFAATWWWISNRRMYRALSTPGRRGAGARHLIFLLFVDLVVIALALFFVGMIVSPWFGL